MNTYKKLIGNSFVFAIGNLGSKVIAFLLIPLYTYFLSTNEFGTIDIITTSVNMLLPIVSASIFEAVLRFTLDKEYDNNQVILNSLIITFLGMLLALIFLPWLYTFNLANNYLLYSYILLFIKILENIFAQYTRAIGDSKRFAFNGILLTLSTGILNIIFLVILSMSIEGYFLAMIFANLISILYLIKTTKVFNSFNLSFFDYQLSLKMIKYALPLIPNTLMYWLINASSRYFIIAFVGVSANGLFAVASKMPGLISIVDQIFRQAWQISAIEENNNKDREQFHSEVFNFLSSVMFIGVVVINMFLKMIFNTMYANEYFIAWRAVPFLLIGAIFSCFSGFLGTNYIAAKETKGIMKSSFYGGVVSIILNFSLIPFFGIVGAGMSSSLSFFVMWIFRLYDTRRFIKMRINWKNLIFNLVIVLFQITIMFWGLSLRSEFNLNTIMLIIVLLVNRNVLIAIINTIKTSVGKYLLKFQN